MLESPSKRLAMISELTIRERPTIPAVVIAVVLLFFTAAYTVLQSKARYGIPLRPFGVADGHHRNQPRLHLV